MADASFWDKAAKKYAATPVKDMRGYEDTLDRTREYLRSGDHLLEVGCGTGTTALTLSTAVRQITATDISGAMLKIAEDKRTEKGVSNVSFVQSEIITPHSDAPFDAICAFSILHLVDDLSVTLEHLFSQIKPGGYLISKTACLRDMNRFIPIIIKVAKAFGKAPDVLMMDASQLEDAFRKAGFEVVETGYFGKNTYARFIVAQRPI